MFGRCQIMNENTISNLRNLVNSKKGKKHINHPKMLKAVNYLDLNDDDRVIVSVFSGCDYLNNIKGFGFGSIIHYFTSDFENKIQKEGIYQLGEEVLYEKIQLAIKRSRS